MLIDEREDMIRYDDVTDTEEELSDKKDRYLRERGWNCNCGHPGSVWLWEKCLNEKTYYVPKDTAVFLQSSFDGDR